MKKINNENIKYIIVGKGPESENLKRLVIKYSLTDQVKIIGFKRDVKELLLASDCFAFPSKREGLGLAAIEAMALGLPVISHDIGGIRDYCVDNITGYLCKKESEYADKIKKIKDSKIDYYHNCTHMASNFDIFVSNNIMIKVYNNIKA